ncbi:MAG TPA: hypothetical protein DD381_05730 [Lentisphaeria bacterium]|nr:MAG: hypothetical protein A2X47_08380 [Lentisphaerae bacterium GWF2_38_69]HBM15825.1 hypothetical protein [Lentisphaeria bacterium]
MTIITSYKKCSLSYKIYISTAAGFCIGMFFGDKCSVLDPLNTMFIKLFQTAIIPFMVFSIVHSIGALTKDRAKRLWKKGSIVLIRLWVISIFYAIGLQFSFPDVLRSSFFHPGNFNKAGGINFYEMFIPSNPFNSLANGFIPAIVIFCILIGIALINHENKIELVKSSEVWASVMNKINNYLMMMLPLGVLVMATFTFGTMSYMQFKGVLLYIMASIFYLLFIPMVIYPVILTSISKMRFS